jgi:hypothetical protein
VDAAGHRAADGVADAVLAPQHLASRRIHVGEPVARGLGGDHTRFEHRAIVQAVLGRDREQRRGLPTLDAVARRVEPQSQTRRRAHHGDRKPGTGCGHLRHPVDIGPEGEQAAVGTDAELPIGPQHRQPAHGLAEADVPDVVNALHPLRHEHGRAQQVTVAGDERSHDCLHLLGTFEAAREPNGRAEGPVR